MICEACHGQQTFPPCPECGGCGIAHCNTVRTQKAMPGLTAGRAVIGLSAMPTIRAMTILGIGTTCADLTGDARSAGTRGNSRGDLRRPRHAV